MNPDPVSLQNPLNSWLFSLLCGCCLPAEPAATGSPSPSPCGSSAQPTREWAQGTAADEDASLSPKQSVLCPSSFQTVTMLGVQAIHLQWAPGTCSAPPGFHSFTQVQLLLRGWRHTLHKQLHCWSWAPSRDGTMANRFAREMLVPTAAVMQVFSSDRFLSDRMVLLQRI